MKKFEYLSFQDKIRTEMLDQLGAEGWELVSHTAVTYGGAGLSQYYIFKREIEEYKNGN